MSEKWIPIDQQPDPLQLKLAIVPFDQAQSLSKDIAAIVSDIHRLLIESLELPTPFKSGDPDIGEAYGMLGIEGKDREDKLKVNYNFQFLASSAFDSPKAARDWSIFMEQKLMALVPRVKFLIDKRRKMIDFTDKGSVVLGQPRSPLEEMKSQLSHIWVVDVLLPCRIQVMEPQDSLGLLV